VFVSDKKSKKVGTMREREIGGGDAVLSCSVTVLKKTFVAVQEIIVS